MICPASSKHKSMRSARMWNKRSPGVATAWRPSALISRNGCNSAGRGSPKRRSQASDPKPMMQERFPAGSRKPTARNSPDRSPHNDRTDASLTAPGLIVRTRKIAARVGGAATGWGIGLELSVAMGMVIGSGSIRWCPGGECEIARAPDDDNPRGLPCGHAELHCRSRCKEGAMSMTAYEGIHCGCDVEASDARSAALVSRRRMLGGALAGAAASAVAGAELAMPSIARAQTVKSADEALK